MASEGRIALRRPLRRMGQARLGEGREPQRLGRTVGKRAAVGDDRLVGRHERRALRLERPAERVAARGLVGGGGARRRQKRRRQNEPPKRHCEVTVAAGAFNWSGFAPCSSSTAASSCVSLARSGGT